MKNSFAGPIACAVFGVATAFGALPAAAISLSVDPVFQQLMPGDGLSVDVVVSGLHDEDPDEIVSAFDLALGYDPTILTPTGVTFGGFLDDPDSVANGGLYDPFMLIDLAFDLSTVGYSGPFTAAVEFGQLALLPAQPDPINFPGAQGLDGLQPDSFILATVAFDAIALGASALGIIEDSSPDVAVPGLDLKGNDALTPLSLSTVNGATVAVVDVAEPGTLWLGLLGAAIGAAGFGRRRSM